LWLTKISDTPRDCNRRTRANKRGDLGSGQRRGGLVHDDDLGVADERPADGGQLLVGNRQGRDIGIQIKGQAELVDDPLRDGAGCAGRIEPATHSALARHGDVLGHAEVRKEREVLVDDLNPGCDGAGRGHARVPLAADDDHAGVGGLHATDDLDERRLPAAVLTSEAVHLAGQEREGHGVEGVHTTVGLDDVAELQHGPWGR
jgi:hypothetical protein